MHTHTYICLKRTEAMMKGFAFKVLGAKDRLAKGRGRDEFGRCRRRFGGVLGLRLPKDLP